jgi:hypothetical protein
MSERKDARTARVTVESQGHVNGAPETKTSKFDDQNNEGAKAAKNPKH